MNIVWTNNIFEHSCINYPIYIDNYWANILFSDNGDLYIEDHAKGYWNVIDSLPIVNTPVYQEQHYVPDKTLESIESAGHTLDAAINILKETNEQKPLKIISKTVNNEGNIVELIVRKPRSKNERSEIVECERASKERDRRRKERKGKREIKRTLYKVT